MRLKNNKRTVKAGETSPFIGVTPEQLGRYCPHARCQVFRHRGTIFYQGESLRDVFCIVQGQVTLARVSPDGVALTTAALSAGDFLGATLGENSTCEDTAKAKGEVTIWRVPVAEFQRLLLGHPAFALEFITKLSRRNWQLARRLEGFAFRSTEARLAETMRELSDGFATRCEHGFGQHLRLTQQELADLVGASRPVVSTILNRLRKQGVLNYNRDYVCVRRFTDIETLIVS